MAAAWSLASHDSHLFVAIARGYRVTRIKRRPRVAGYVSTIRSDRPSVHLSIKSDHNYTPYSDTVEAPAGQSVSTVTRTVGRVPRRSDLRNFVYTP